MKATAKRIVRVFLLAAVSVCLISCSKKNSQVSIGVSMGVGDAIRWEMEKEYMEEHAEELGIQIDARIHKAAYDYTQIDDCKDLIDSGIDVLILTLRDAADAPVILEYAKAKKVPVISYARVILGEKVDLFVGYDSNRIGQKMGQYLSEMVYEGDYILLRGSEDDNNATLLYEGAMRYIDPIRSNINVLLDSPVDKWDPAIAKELVKEAVAANNNQIDAILAPNDKLAGACAEALEELGVEQHVVITGMDAELDAIQRIIAGTQDNTFYMDLKVLATTAVDEACHIAKGEKVNVNADFDNQSGGTIDSNLITGQMVTKDNLDKILIDSGYFTREQIYGVNK